MPSTVPPTTTTTSDSAAVKETPAASKTPEATPETAFWDEQIQKQGLEAWYGKAIEYWSNQEASVNGVLGGYGYTSNGDLKESKAVLTHIKKQIEKAQALRKKREEEEEGKEKENEKKTGEEKTTGEKGKKETTSTKSSSSILKELESDWGLTKFGSVLDCGAGIGRISDKLLSTQFETIDVLEPVDKLMDAAKRTLGPEGRNIARNFFKMSLQEWNFMDTKTTEEGIPTPLKYDVVWNQWVLLYLTDNDLIAYLKKCKAALNPGGFIFVKENVIVEDKRGKPKEYVMDDDDNSVTRTDRMYREIFKKSGLDTLIGVQQKEWPQDLYPIYMYVLK